MSSYIYNKNAMRYLLTILLIFTIITVVTSQNFIFIDLVHDKGIPVERYSFDRYNNKDWLSNQLKVGSEGVLIYPNPVSHYLINGGASNVRIYDISGRLLIETSDKKINVRTLSPGYYWVVVDDTGSIIIKQ